MIEFSFASIFIFVIIVSLSPAFDNLERLRADLFFISAPQTSRRAKMADQSK